jgi:hypothetical protein
VIWACYAFFIGRLGGKAFEDKPWAGLLLAFGGTLAISGLVELVRRLMARRTRRRADAQGQGDAEHQDNAQSQADAEDQGDAQGQADAQGKGDDTQSRGDAQSQADTHGQADAQGQGDAQGHADDRECGMSSSDDAPTTPVR